MGNRRSGESNGKRLAGTIFARAILGSAILVDAFLASAVLASAVLGSAALVLAMATPAGAIEPGLNNATIILPSPTIVSAPVGAAKAKVPVGVGVGADTEPTISAKSSTKATAKIITLVAVGDTGLNAHMAPVRPRGGYKHGGLIPWARATKDIAGEIDGDVNFMNLETIVTNRNGLRRENKSFNFRMHPNGARHLVKIGFNLFSTANNHSMDFAAAGARDTLKHLERLGETAGLLAWPGLGLDREQAGRPWPMDIKGSRIMASALGITTGGFPRHRAGARRVGQLSYQSRADFAQLTNRLSKTLAAYKILSVHYGIERDVRVDRSERAKLGDIALRGADIDLVLGHHAHVARGVELSGGKVILYGLGNFLHHGTANMAVQGMCRDYGLMAKLHLLQGPGGRLAMRAIEVLPLTNMHRQTRRMQPRAGRERVHVLNYLARALDNSKTGAKGVRFTPRKDGSGLFCMAGSGRDPGRIGKLCKGWQAPDVTPRALARRIANSCTRVARTSTSTRSPKGRKRRGGRKGKRRQNAKSGKSGKSFFSQIFGD